MFAQELNQNSDGCDLLVLFIAVVKLYGQAEKQIVLIEPITSGIRVTHLKHADNKQ